MSMAPTAKLSWNAIVWLLAISGIGMPPSVPPLPEDPAVMNVAPEKCLVYLSSAGTAEADPNSPNQTEQLMAEPEVRRMANEIERAVREALKNFASQDVLSPGLSADEIVELGKTLTTRPLTAYVSDAQISRRGPIFRGGIVINCSDRLDKMKALVDRMLKSVPPKYVEKVQIDGAEWTSIKFTPLVKATLGFKDERFYLALGDGELQEMLARGRGESPKWLAELREKMPVERTSTIIYVNTQAVMQLGLPLAGPKVGRIVDAVGFDNVTSLASVSGLDKEGFVTKTLWSIDGRPRGFFRLAEIEPLAPGDLTVVPQDATFAAAFKVDPAKMFDVISEIIEKIEPDAKKEFDHAFEIMAEQYGLNMRDDILAPLGDTWRIYDSPSEGGVISGLTAVVEVKDHKRAAETLRKLNDLWDTWLKEQANETHGDPHLLDRVCYLRSMRVERLEFNGEVIHSFNGMLLGPPCTPAWCLTDKELIISLNPQGIKGYLSRGKDFKSLAGVPEVAELFQGDSGPMKFAYCNSQRIFDILYPAVLSSANFSALRLRLAGIDMNTSMIPSARAIRPHLRPSVMSARRVPSGIEIIERRTVPGPSVAALAPVGVGALIPAVQSARQSSKRVQSMNNMKQIALSMMVYECAHKKFPPAYIVDKDGKPLLSWRVMMLPYIERSNLYSDFHLDEPWDSPHNKKLIERMPSVFRSPNSKLRDKGKTNYLTVRGENTIFPGKKRIGLADIRDGTSNTIMTVEVSDDSAVIWTKPDDFAYNEKDPKKGLLGLRRGGFLAGFADGSVRFIPARIDPKTLIALFTCAGKETIPSDY